MKSRLLTVLVVALALAATACQAGQAPATNATPTPSKPTVVINSPPSNTQVQNGQATQIQSTSVDREGIVLVELIVDGQTVQSSPTPNGQPQTQFSVIQSWTPSADGAHTVTVRATNAHLVTAEASISVTVGSQVALLTPTATLVVTTPTIPTATALAPTAVPPTAAPPPTCTLASTFISDVTIPDGTVVAPGSTFVKTWAIQNSGTCNWGGGYNAVLVGGESFNAASPQPIPAASPGNIINISITMVAPTAPGTHSSIWQIQASNGVLFGTKFDAVINVPGAPTARPPTPIPPTAQPSGCVGTPVFSSFTANPLTIAPGQISTLSWGHVSNANAVYLTSPSGTQGVGTPGNLQVQPSTTTTYSLTAYCGNTPAQLQLTITVQGGGGGCSGTPVFNGFYANPSTISAGQQSTLSWGLVQNANAVFLQLPDRTDAVGTPGSRAVKPDRTRTYTLVAYCGSNQVSISTTVNVNTGCVGVPVFNGFSANPGTIQRGQSSTLSWGFVANATSVTLQTPDGSSGVATPGNLVVSPKRSQTYTLVAYCQNRSASLSVTVNVNNPSPTPTPPPPVNQNRINNIDVAKNGAKKWRLTVNYFWNGDAPPARIEAYGTANGNAVVTNRPSQGIIAGFTKFVILEVQQKGNLAPNRFTVCMVGRGNNELVCRNWNP